jgi:hypothetical protein
MYVDRVHVVDVFYVRYILFQHPVGFAGRLQEYRRFKYACWCCRREKLVVSLLLSLQPLLCQWTKAEIGQRFLPVAWAAGWEPGAAMPLWQSRTDSSTGGCPWSTYSLDLLDLSQWNSRRKNNTRLFKLESGTLLRDSPETENETGYCHDLVKVAFSVCADLETPITFPFREKKIRAAPFGERANRTEQRAREGQLGYPVQYPRVRLCCQLVCDDCQRGSDHPANTISTHPVAQSFPCVQCVIFQYSLQVGGGTPSRWPVWCPGMASGTRRIGQFGDSCSIGVMFFPFACSVTWTSVLSPHMNLCDIFFR